jgi:NADP-dependent 3-hydroxy acid dehydrogenase YdfG
MNNLFYGLRLLRDIYEWRRPNSTVVFFGGPNPNIATKNYSAYTTSKIALTKLVECLDEEEDTKFMILGPGKVKTKIQNQTLEAGYKAGENYQKVKEFMKSGKSTSHDEIYEFVKTCISLPKEVVGGRNISIRDDWKNLKKVGYNQFKLRRGE